MARGPITFWLLVVLSAGLLIVAPLLGGGSAGDYVAAVAGYWAGSLVGLACFGGGKG